MLGTTEDMKIPSFNPFDFSDTTGLPDDLVKRLAKGADDKAREWADVVKLAAHFGESALDIAQIIGAVHKLNAGGYNIDIPAESTVRGYLNRGIELGLITKPTRQTYAPAVGKKGRTVAATVESTPAVATEEVSAVEEAPAETTSPVEDVLAGI